MKGGLRYTLSLTLGLATLIVSNQAMADRGEIQVSAAPVVSMLERHERLNVGGGGLLAVRYGLRRYLDLELAFQGDHFRDLGDSTSQVGGSAGQMYYDTTRLAMVPSLLFRTGARYILTFGGGIGYRVEIEGSRQFVPQSGLFPENLSSQKRHQLLSSVIADFEWRFSNHFSAGTRVSWFVPLTNRYGSSWADIAVGIALSAYMYP